MTHLDAFQILVVLVGLRKLNKSNFGKKDQKGKYAKKCSNRGTVCYKTQMKYIW